MLNFFKKYWKTLLASTLIILLSSVSGNDIDKIRFVNIPYSDKIIHFSMYFFLSFLIIYDYRIANHLKNFRINLFSLLISFLLGLLMEILQKFVFFQRNFDIYDLVFNFSGALAAILAFEIIFTKILKHRR